METLSLKIKVTCPNSGNNGTGTETTRGIIKVDGKELQKIQLTGKESQEHQLTLDLDEGEHTLSIEHTFSESPVSALVIEHIEIDEIDLGVLTYNGVYTPTYPEPWYSDEVTAGRPPKQQIGNGMDGSSCLFMGWEGKYELKFSTPLYEWLLQNI